MTFRTTRIGCVLVAALVTTALATGGAEAQASWSQPRHVVGSARFADPVVAFDARNTPWVAWNVDPEPGARPGLFVAKMTAQDRLASIHRIPGSEKEVLESSPDLAVDSAGYGILAWSYIPEYGSFVSGSSVDTWRLGTAPSKRVELVASHSQATPSIAVNDRGVALVMYDTLEFPKSEGGTRTGTLDVARLSAGRILAREQLAAVTDGPTALNPEVSAATGEGFLASWELEGGAADHFATLGVASAQANANSAFPAAQLSPFQTPISRSFKLISDARGDQLATWTTGPETTATPQTLYIASRRHGQLFGKPQALGHKEFETGPAQLAIGQTGHFTVLWTQPRGTRHTTVMAASGQVGGAAGSAQLLDSATNIGGPQLVLTGRGEAVAAWWSELPSHAMLVRAAVGKRGTTFARAQTIFTHPRPSSGCGSVSLWPDRRGGVLAVSSCGGEQTSVVQTSSYQPSS